MGCNESAAPFGPEQQPRIQVAPLVLYQPAQWGNQQPDGGPAVCQAFPALRLSTPERYTVASLWHSWHEHTEASLEAGYTFFLKFERIWCPEVSTTIYSLYYSNTHTARQRNASVYISVQHSNIFKVHCAMAALFLFITLFYFCSFLLLLWVQKGIKALTPTPQYSYSVVCCCSTPVCFLSLQIFRSWWAVWFTCVTALRTLRTAVCWRQISGPRSATSSPEMPVLYWASL